jgi:hypothetical protein
MICIPESYLIAGLVLAFVSGAAIAWIALGPIPYCEDKS